MKADAKPIPHVVDFDSERAAEDAVRALPDYSEDETALAFADRHHELLRFDHSTGNWYVYNSNRWQRDPKQLALNYARTFGRRLAEERRVANRMRLRSLKFAQNVDRLARTDPRMAVTNDIWDADLDLLGTPNMVINLETGEEIEPHPDLYITRSTAVDPDIETDCDRWLQFLNQITNGDAALMRFLQLWAGYSLTGETREQKLVFIHGPGGTGKSTFAITLQRIMKDYAISAAMETFADARFDQHPEQLARLDGMRMVVASETEAGHKWRENRVKLLTGGDLITARYMRENSFDFPPRFKLTFLGNHAPAISNLDTAIQRRFLVVPFMHKPDAPDLRLDEILTREMPGILRWMLNGAVDWYSNGLVLPKAVTEATSRYFDEQNIFGQWLEECCVVDLENNSLIDKTADLFASWSTFAKSHGEVPGTQTTFNDKLRSAGFEPKQHKSLGTKGCRGIRLKSTSHWQESGRDQ